MGVNSAFKGFSNNRLVMRPGMTIVMFAIFFIASAFKEWSDRDLRTKQINLIIREIGHRLLLQAGDLTSRVLPVSEVRDGTFLLRFENEFIFSNDSLMTLSKGLLPETQFPSGYTVTVHDCMNDAIVYGFQVNIASPDIMPCRGRHQLLGCYTIEFAFTDLYAEADQKKADIGQEATEESKPVITDHRKASNESAEVKTKAVDVNQDRLIEASRSVETNFRQATTPPEEFKESTFDYASLNFIYSGMLTLLSVALLIGRFGKSLKPVSLQNQKPAVVKESVPELAPLGKFLFDVKDQRLLSGSETISLTDKECRILELLNKSFGELISRETLMQKVWINEGVITGRSLDMFVSKLRKKLSSDPELRITNVHGKGYKLETPGTP